MQFCDVCRNLMYMRLNERGRPSLHCRACGNTQPVDLTEGLAVPVFTKAFVDASSQFMTPHIESDPTLPHVNNIPCPNKACTKPADAPSDVMYMKYDHRNMKYVYHCVHCKTFWKND